MTASSDRLAGSLVGLATGAAVASGADGWSEPVRRAVDVASLSAAGNVASAAVVGQATDRAGGQLGPAACLAATTSLALAHLGDDEELVAAARAMSRRVAGGAVLEEACAVWAVAVDRAVRERRLGGAHDAVGLLDADAATAWTARLDAAATHPPEHFRSPSAVSLVQGALAAVWQTPPAREPDDCVHLQHAVRAATHAGADVAALAGSLLGARWGVSAIPFRWRRRLHGPRGRRPADLVRWAVLTATGGVSEESGWPGDHQLADNPEAHHGNAPVAVAVPDDSGLVAGNLAAIRDVEVDAVVSLCQVGCCELPEDVEHHHVLLFDAHGANPNCGFVLDEAVEALRVLRGEGKRVFVHCVGAASRTPSVVAGYLVRAYGLAPEEAIERVGDLLWYPQHNQDFRAWLLASGPREGG